MLTWDFLGACEGDLRIDGVGVVNRYGSIGLARIDADTGAMVPISAAPPQLIRWPRVTPSGPIKISGQAQDLGSYEWLEHETAWQQTGPAHGASPTIYDGGNVLYIIRPAADQTVNGYRCLDRLGRPVLGEATLAIATIPDGRLLHKYTPIETPNGPILVGQDHESGCHIVYAGDRYILDEGNVEFIRAAWSPITGLSILITHYDRQLVRTFRLTVDEIARLPRFHGTPDPPIDPPIDPPPAVRPPKFTIASPSFPPEGITVPVPGAVRCVYANEPGGGPLEWIEWRLGPSASGPWTVNARNPGDDPDHTYRFQAAGAYYINARGGNQAGTHQTGAARLVTVLGPVDPPDPPPAADRWRLQTVHGGFLRVRPDRFLEEGTSGDLFEIVPSDRPPLIGLKVQGGIVAAEPGGQLKADRGSVSDWEYFDRHVIELLPRDGPIWQFRSDWLNRWISAHDDGTVLADMVAAEAWESFTPIAGPAPVEYSRWYVDRHLFRNLKGEAVRVQGYSGFPLLRQFADGGANVVPMLEYFQPHGANLVRVWAYLPPGHPILGGWEPPTTDQIIRGIQAFRAYGLTTYLTLLTDDDPARIPWAEHTVRELGAAGLDSLILEIGNEPQIGKSIDTEALRAVCDASGLLYTSGEYADSARWFGTHGDAHTPRDFEWPRKAHDLHEYQVGGGPSYPAEPACQVPWFAGEPIKPTEAPNAPQTDDRGVTIYRAEDFLAYGATCGLLGAGAVFHYEGGKTGQIPSGDEIACCSDFFEGLRAFPADMMGPGSYQRIDEHGATLRTYRKGPYEVRIRPTSVPIIVTDAGGLRAEAYLVAMPARVSDADENLLIRRLRENGVTGPIVITVTEQGMH